MRCGSSHGMNDPRIIAAAVIAFAATTTNIITIGDGIGNVNRNAPAVIRFERPRP